MQEKSTNLLECELSSCADLHDFLKINATALHVPDFQTLLEQYRQRSGLSRAQLARLSGLHTVYVYQLFSGQRHPGRDTLLCLCFALGLHATDTQRLLRVAGHGQLYVRSRRDSIIYFGLENELPLATVNQQLDECGEPALS